MRFHLVRPNIHRSRPDREGGIICQGPQPVTIPAFGHDRCAPLEITILSAADLRAPCVGLSGAMRTSTQPAGPHRVGPRSGLDDELPDLVARYPHAYVREDLMEVLQFRFAPLLLDDPSVLPQASKVKGLVDAGQNDKRCLRRCGWQLFEIWCSFFALAHDNDPRWRRKNAYLRRVVGARSRKGPARQHQGGGCGR